MIEEIAKKYDNFSDSLILKIIYLSVNNDAKDNGYMEILIDSFNGEREYAREKIKLLIKGIIKCKFLQEQNGNSVFINTALLKKENDIIIIDFFPIPGFPLELDPDSNFYIYCKAINYEVVEQAVTISS